MNIIHPMTKKLLLFDVDGTLTECIVPGQPCPNNPTQWKWKKNVLEVVRLYPEDVQTAWITNQGGIALGYMTVDQHDEIMDSMRKWWPRPAHVMVCPHAPNGQCPCRKPSPYMLLRACLMLQADRDQAIFVGDYHTDETAAKRAGIEFVWAKDFFGWSEV